MCAWVSGCVGVWVGVGVGVGVGGWAREGGEIGGIGVCVCVCVCVRGRGGYLWRCVFVILSLCNSALRGFAPSHILPPSRNPRRVAPEKSRRPGGSQGGVAWRRILAEGAIALPVTLSGGALFAS